MEEEQHEVVIVGAGIAGLATAVALKIVGLQTLVLERSPELRATGAAIGLSSNAWRALDVLGVAHKLLPSCPTVPKTVVTDLPTGSIQAVPFTRSQRGDTATRIVHRKDLLETLAEELKPGTIRFSSKITSIDQDASSSVTAVHLDDGSVVKAKVLIGCDGVHSVVARWLGLSEPVHSGRSAVRGLAVFPEGHGLKNGAAQYVIDDKRAGFAPLNSNDLYWFITHPSTAREKEIERDPELILAEVTEKLAVDFPPEFQMVVRHVDLATLSWAPLVFRLPWDVLLGRIHKGCVTVAGDAMHPMTPDLAQGGCTALEDAIVLARNLAGARSRGQLAAGLESYVRERRWRATWLIAASYLSGWVQQGGNAGVWRSSVEWFRRNIYYKFLHSRIFFAVHQYDCGDLLPAE
ncbi:monooxygenase 2-like [Musa acuminata AAA Group]|uniref:monooxygenase 2-like n=1 Tax=Musa acuminata AAA Group TaxID=214697 RepID=UPI0031D80FAE